MENFVVYAYSRQNGTFYYIGKGRPSRPYKKRKTGIKPPKDNSRIHILHANLPENLAFEYERNLITFYGRKDLGIGLLHNRTNGGEGVSGWVPRKEWRINKSKSMEGKNNSFYGLCHTNRSKELISKGNKGKSSGEKNYFYGKKFIGKENPMFGRKRPDLSLRNVVDSSPVKGTKWYNNGVIDKRFKPDQAPEGFKLGRLKISSGYKRPDVSERNKKRFVDPN
jgi:hypothetical protein